MSVTKIKNMMTGCQNRSIQCKKDKFRLGKNRQMEHSIWQTESLRNGEELQISNSTPPERFKCRLILEQDTSYLRKQYFLQFR